MNCGIYKWTSPSGKSYIGQSVNLERRHYDFSHKERYSNPYGKNELTVIDKARIKYPDFTQWTYEILEYCEPNELNDKEQYYINLYGTFNNGYNVTIGGKGCNGYKMSEDFKQQLSVSRIGENNPMYGKTPWNKNQKLPEETRKKISLAKKGKPSPLKGKKKTPEQIEKNRQSHLGQVAWNKGMRFPSKHINQYSKDGVLIKSYESVNDIDIGREILTCHIYECCNGKRKTSYGYIWRYASDIEQIVNNKNEQDQ